MSREAWVTLATNDDSAVAALVLGQSIRRTGSDRKLHIIITTGVTDQIRKHLTRVFDDVSDLEYSEGQNEGYASLWRPDLAGIFAKLHCWRLVQYEKCVFIESDCLMLKNCDTLFSFAELSAAPDVGWPDNFNSGVFVLVPNYATYDKLMDCARQSGSFSGGDQVVLNDFFSDWRLSQERRLPFVFNVSLSVSYTYIAAFKRFAQDVRIVHFVGDVKPWNHKFNILSSDITSHNLLADYSSTLDHIRLWWCRFVEDVMPFLFDVPEKIIHEERSHQPIAYFYEPPLPLLKSAESDIQSGEKRIEHAQFRYEPEKAIQYQQDSAAPINENQHYPPHHPPAHKPPFIGAVTFNIEPAHFVFTDKPDKKKDWWVPSCPEVFPTGEAIVEPVTPRASELGGQPWQPPELPAFARELAAVDRPCQAPPRFWPPALAPLVAGLDHQRDPETLQILAEICRVVPTDVLSSSFRRDLEIPSHIFENRLTECPICQESFSYLDKYFPVKDKELEPDDACVATIQDSTDQKSDTEKFDYEDYQHKLCWEQGRVDYAGRDSSDNILQFLMQNMQ